MGIKQKRKLILDLKRELFLKYQSNLKVCLIEGATLPQYFQIRAVFASLKQWVAPCGQADITRLVCIGTLRSENLKLWAKY